jgi:hypothetical protein
MPEVVQVADVGQWGKWSLELRKQLQESQDRLALLLELLTTCREGVARMHGMLETITGPAKPEAGVRLPGVPPSRFICEGCGKEGERKNTRGPVPRWCPACKAALKRC